MKTVQIMVEHDTSYDCGKRYEIYIIQTQQLQKKICAFKPGKNILKQFVGNLPNNCLRVFNNFVELAPGVY